MMDSAKEEIVVQVIPIEVTDFGQGNSRCGMNYNTMTVSIEYKKGGINYFTDERYERGFYVKTSLTKEDNGGRSLAIGGFGGHRKLISGASRFSRTTLERLAQDCHVNAVIQELIEATIADGNLRRMDKAAAAA
jgi:hypothetical protein